MNEKQEMLLRTHTKATARRLTDEIHFLESLAHKINGRIKHQKEFLKILYDKMLEAGVKDYSIEEVLGIFYGDEE